jgi:hypothetical protein
VRPIAQSTVISETDDKFFFINFNIISQHKSLWHECSFILVNETNLVKYLLLVYVVNFIYNLYVFRTSPGPLSGGTTVFLWHLALIILYNWLSGMHDRNKYQVSQKYSGSSWWWTWKGPKQVDVTNKIDEVH